MTDSDMATVSLVDARNGMPKKPRLDFQYDSLTPTQAIRTPQDRSNLPAEIWHHIFTYLPPRALGNLLRVNKLFNTFLDPASSFTMTTQPKPSLQSVAKTLEPNGLWKISRRAFWPMMPGPFMDMTELDMWRLACSSTCQFCGIKDERTQRPSSDPYRYGPGADGVARVWEFRVRCCGSCLSSKTVKVRPSSFVIVFFFCSLLVYLHCSPPTVCFPSDVLFILPCPHTYPLRYAHRTLFIWV